MLSYFLLFERVWGGYIITVTIRSCTRHLIIKRIFCFSSNFFRHFRNVLGSCVNWWLGFKIEHFKHKKWFPISEKRLEQAQSFYHKYGFYSLLLSWTPVIGDPITLVAGLFKENFWRF